MVDRPRSAAASLYPHLPHDDGRVANWAKQRRERNDIADAMWPGPPKPQLKNIYAEILLKHLRQTRIELQQLKKEGKL